MLDRKHATFLQSVLAASREAEVSSDYSQKRSFSLRGFQIIFTSNSDSFPNIPGQNHCLEFIE